MRYLRFFPIMLLAAAGQAYAQTAAQPAAAQTKPASSQAGAQTAGGTQEKKPEDGKKSDPVPAKDASMANYDVNGSSAADAMGAAP